MDILAEVRRAIRQHDLISRGETVIVGVSGGPDSLCLLHALRMLRGEFGCSLHVAHLNHQLRGAEADADARFVADLAARWELPCTIGARDVADLARRHKLSLEEAARHARYAFLSEVATTHSSRTVAVAHNADDQAESVLMHFLRGSGSAGLRGMLPKSDMANMRLKIGDSSFIPHPSSFRLVRPLLEVPRSDIEAYCLEHELSPRFDRSNLDTTFFRNRLRHELLPQLETYNPNIRAVLRRTADVIAAEVEVLRAATERAWHETMAAESGDAIRFRLIEWRGLPRALQRATLREAIHRLRPSLRNMNFVHVENAVEQLQTARTGARITLPQGLMVNVGYDAFALAPASHALHVQDGPSLRSGGRLSIARPGITPLPDSIWRLEATYPDRWGDDLFNNPDRWTAYLDADATGSDLSIRARRAGDVFHPQGMPVPARLADWMTNVKIPRDARDGLPLIVTGDRIVWVAGVRIGQPFIVTPNTRRVLRLSFHRTHTLA